MIRQRPDFQGECARQASLMWWSSGAQLAEQAGVMLCHEERCPGISFGVPIYLRTVNNDGLLCRQPCQVCHFATHPWPGWPQRRRGLVDRRQRPVEPEDRPPPVQSHTEAPGGRRCPSAAGQMPLHDRRSSGASSLKCCWCRPGCPVQLVVRALAFSLWPTTIMLLGIRRGSFSCELSAGLQTPWPSELVQFPRDAI